MADTKTVELEGQRYEVPADASMDEIDAYIQSKGGGGAADLTKTAAPKYEPEFGPTLSREFFGGASDVGTGLGNMFSLPGPDTRSDNALGAAQTGLGILRMLSSPIAASGSQVGETAGETVRSATEPYLGPTGSAIAGTAVGAPLNLATQLVVAPAIISRAIPVAMRMVQGGAKLLPGAQVALREIGKKAIAQLPSILKPAQSADSLYETVRTMGSPSIVLPEFSKAAKEVLKTEQQLGQFGEAAAGLASGAAKKVSATTQEIVNEFGDITTQLKPVPFDVIQKLRQRLGARIGELRLSGSTELGSVKQLYKHLSKDLESAANQGTGPIFAKLKEADKAANREFAIGELDDIFNSTMGLAREGATFTSSNFAQALNKIKALRRNDELFAKGLGNVHLDRIERQLDELYQLKVLPPPSGQNVGSRSLLASGGALGSAGTAIGAMVGGGMGATIGGGIGGTVGFAAPLIISRIMQSPSASRQLTSLLRKTGEVSPESFAALIALAKTEQIDDDTGFKAIMKSAETDIKQKIAAASERFNLQRENLMAKKTLGINSGSE